MAAALSVPTSFWTSVHRAGGGRSWPPEGPGELEHFVEAVERHRLGTIAAATLASEPAVGGAVVEKGRAIEREVAQRTREQAATLSRVVSLLPSGSYIGVKGVDFGKRLYGDPTLRPMSDLDLLVREEELPSHARILCGAGFRGPHAAGPLAVVFEDPSNGVVVDLYRGFIQRQRVAIDYPSVWAAAEPAGDGMLYLCRSHALLTYALGMASTEFVTHFRRYLDLWLLCRDGESVLEALERARCWKMRRVVWASFTLLARVVPEIREEPWYASVDELLAPSEGRAMERRLLPESPAAAAPHRIARIWRKLSLIDSPRQRLGFVAAHIAKGGLSGRSHARSLKRTRRAHPLAG